MNKGTGSRSLKLGKSTNEMRNLFLTGLGYQTYRLNVYDLFEDEKKLLAVRNFQWFGSTD
ncbi:MAG TPA: hypothetical protein VGE40_11855 [Bacilli bacterium]